MGRNVSYLVLCPHYKGEDAHKIVCEGLQPMSSVHVAFSEPKDRKAWEKRACKSWEWERCPIAEMHERRYQEEAGE